MFVNTFEWKTCWFLIVIIIIIIIIIKINFPFILSKIVDRLKLRSSDQHADRFKSLTNIVRERLAKPVSFSKFLNIERFHSRGQHLWKFTGTKGSVCIRKEFNSHRICFEHQHGRRFIVWDTNMAAVTSCENVLFTSVSLGSSPHSYLFTSATVRVPVHTTLKCGTEPIRYVTRHFRKSARRSFTPLQSPLLCVNRSPIRCGLRVGAVKSSPGLVWT